MTNEEEAAVPAIAATNDLTKQTHSEVTAEALDLAIKMVDFEAGAGILRVRQAREANRGRDRKDL